MDVSGNQGDGKEICMRRTNVLDRGVRNDGAPCADALEAALSQAEKGEEFYFPEGVYFLDRAVTVEGKDGLALTGDRAVLMTHFSSTEDLSVNNDAFRFVNCSDLTIEGFACTTDNYVNCMGTVVSIDYENRTYDVEIDPQYEVTGWEHFYGAETFDENRFADYAIETYDNVRREEVPQADGSVRTKIVGVEYECLGGQRIRVKFPDRTEKGRYAAYSFDTNRFHVGHRVVYRYEIYGNTVFHFAGCRRVALLRIEVERCPAMAAVVAPRSEDFLFKDFNVRPKKGDPSLYTSGSDAIHILGLSGSLTMENCSFCGLGDDALNIHGRAGEIESFDPATGKLKCVYRPANGPKTIPMPEPTWGQPGDVLRVYDRNTFLEKGRITLDSYEDSRAHASSWSGTPAAGDILANDEYFASVHIKNCEVSCSRCRGFLMQSQNMLVEGSRFYGLSYAGIVISPDIRRWYEVGPSDHVEIRNCTFERCDVFSSRASRGAIVVNACHDTGYSEYPAGVHTDVSIHDNVFKNCDSSAVFVACTKGVEVNNNRFERCSFNAFDDGTGEMDYDIVLKNCTDIRVEGNETDKKPEMLARRITTCS